MDTMRALKEFNKLMEQGKKSQALNTLRAFGFLGLINDKPARQGLEKTVPEKGDQLKLAYVDTDTAKQIVCEERNHVYDTLHKVIKDNKELAGILVAIDGYTVTQEDISITGEHSLRISPTESRKIPGNSAMAIIDRLIHKEGKQPAYELQTYTDTQTGEIREGILLTGIKELHEQAASHLTEGRGILGFINKKEPGTGTIPLEAVRPSQGDTLSLAYVQSGRYKGDFHEGNSLEPLNPNAKPRSYRP